MAKQNRPSTQSEKGVMTKTREQTKKPSMYRVVLLNDDFTPMDFVVAVLQSVFDKTHQEATQIMLSVHETGIGVCGVYTFEIAETKASQVLEMARRSMHPLQCEIEKV